MTVSTEICNLALGIAKQDATIVSLSDSSTAAKRCDRFYAPLLKSLLQSYPWSFARRVVYLSLLDEASTKGYAYVYAFPSSALRLETVRIDGTGGDVIIDRDQYAVFASSDLKSKQIHTNIEKAKAEITVDIVDENMFDPIFIEYFAAALAVKLGLIYKLNQSDMNDIKQHYAEMKSVAEASTSNEELRSFDTENEYIDVR